MATFDPALFRARRLARELTREQLGKDTGYSPLTVKAVELGSITPSVRALVRFADVLQCSVGDLFRDGFDATGLPSKMTELGPDVEEWLVRSLADAPPMSEVQTRRVSAILFSRSDVVA
jgi:transcriptional regulator with XRE-family HTH domain